MLNLILPILLISKNYNLKNVAYKNFVGTFFSYVLLYLVVIVGNKLPKSIKKLNSGLRLPLTFFGKGIAMSPRKTGC